MHPTFMQARTLIDILNKIRTIESAQEMAQNHSTDLRGINPFSKLCYYKTYVTLVQAGLEEKEVKIINVPDETLNYKFVVYEDGNFYGVKDNRRKT